MYAIEQVGTGFEFYAFAGHDPDRMTRARIAAGAFRLVNGTERTETDQGQLFAVFQCVGGSFDECVQRFFGFRFRQAGVFDHAFDELSFVHDVCFFD